MCLFSFCSGHVTAAGPRLWRYWFSRKLLLLLTCLLLAGPAVFATPPEYKTFGREQRVDSPSGEEAIMRIWVIYTGQGDAILIQLPATCNYAPGQDGRIEVLVDGGAKESDCQHNLGSFLDKVQGGQPIEYAVISHQDEDHINALTEVLNAGNTRVETILHNGVAMYRVNKRGFKSTTSKDDAVVDRKGDQVTRGMAFLAEDKVHFDDKYLVHDLGELKAAVDDNALQDGYENLAKAIVAEADPPRVDAFPLCAAGTDFINEIEAKHARNARLDDVRFDLLWPRAPRRYKDWGETINGNSVVFRLTYRDFQMLFPGDMNTLSETDMLSGIPEAERGTTLGCDVLKVPHHGSNDNDSDFLVPKGHPPVISVASMGKQGFLTNWHHPSPDVIKALGGPHRVYCTYIRQGAFTYEMPKKELQKMVEPAHIVIETDGRWFRIVRVPTGEADPEALPTLQSTARGDGTRWIRAK